ncbi:hypothetical protein PLESTM_000359000 [Pleodorina starrii]|nr:hypothetical protein PLESTM_000359000 [Pleodorina starrii]
MATCPLGFGGPGAAKGELSSYHCVLCRGLLHDPVVADRCRHVFCSFCIRRFRDCPVCGADIEGTSPDTALASTIGKILLGHAKLLAKQAGAVCPVASAATGAATCPVASVATSSAGSAPPGPDLDVPSVLLHLALQSLAGGNPEAALARLGMCADTLCSSSGGSSQPEAVAAPAAEGKGPQPPEATVAAAGAADPAFDRHVAAAAASADNASRLGAILGCKADCYRRLGDAAAARSHLAASLACLAPWRGRSREADSALSVTHNKLGDMLLLAERLTEAREQYERALEIRRAAAAGAGAAGEAATREAAAAEVVQDLCDLAVSLCKVADVGFAVSEPEVQREGEGEARGDGGGGPEGLDPRLVARYGKVWGALEQLTARLNDLRV